MPKSDDFFFILTCSLRMIFTKYTNKLLLELRSFADVSICYERTEILFVNRNKMIKDSGKQERIRSFRRKTRIFSIIYKENRYKRFYTSSENRGKTVN